MEIKWDVFMEMKWNMFMEIEWDVFMQVEWDEKDALCSWKWNEIALITRRKRQWRFQHIGSFVVFSLTFCNAVSKTHVTLAHKRRHTLAGRAMTGSISSTLPPSQADNESWISNECERYRRCAWLNTLCVKECATLPRFQGARRRRKTPGGGYWLSITNGRR